MTDNACLYAAVIQTDILYGTDEKNLFVEALKEDCEYVVVQIDTDVCAEYGVEHLADD